MIRYRVGKKLGRTIYRCTDENPDGEFVGIMDDSEFALEICETLNQWIPCVGHEADQEK